MVELFARRCYVLSENKNVIIFLLFAVAVDTSDN